MPVLKPFKGIRPQKDKIKQVAVRPFDVLYSPEAKAVMAENRYSFLNMIEPAVPVNGTEAATQLIYEKARDNFGQFIEEGILLQDERPYFYIYQARQNGYIQTGLWACTAIDDYLNNTLKRHELTLSEREKNLMDYLQHTCIDANPVLITYPPVQAIDDLVAEVTRTEPEYVFESEEPTTHRFWVVKDEKCIAMLQQHFAALPCSYIADGHHRAAAAATLGVEKRKKNLRHNGKEEYNYFTSIYFPSNQLHIYEFNRLIADINGFTTEEFIDRIADNFIVSKVETDMYKPSALHNFGMYVENQWYSLTAKPVTYSEDNPVSKLDVSILHDFLLDPILYIKDPRSDRRIDFVGGIKGIEELIERVNSGEMRVAFTLYPTSIAQLMEVADSGNVMPPKSTWFEPKLHVGLVVHQLD